LRMACCICGQTPADEVPWFELDGAGRPTGVLCWCCGDTSKKRYPTLSPDDIKKKVEKEHRFKAQVLRMSAVKLGKDAKHFYPQEVVKQSVSGMRVETHARALSAREFRDEYGVSPDAIGANCIHLRTGTGEVLPFYLDRDPDERPKVTIWHDELMCVNERRMSAEDQLEEDQGQDMCHGSLPIFWGKLFGGKPLPSIPELKAQAEAMKAGGAPGPAGPKVPVVPTRRKLLEADGTMPIVKRQRQSRKGSIASHDIVDGAPKPAAKDTATLPSLADCVMGTAGRGKLSGLQVLYHCLQHIDGARTTGSMDQKEHIIAKRKHRIRVLACGLSPTEVGKAADGEVEQCYTEVIQADEGPLPTRMFFNLLKRVFLKPKGERDWRECEEAVWRFADPTPSARPSKEPMAPQGLPDIPADKLPATERWKLSHWVWLELIFPHFLSTSPTPTSIDVLQACREGFERTSRGATPLSPEGSLLLESFALVCAPWQASPLTPRQMELLRQFNMPEEAPSHVQVLAELASTAWKTQYRKTMSHTLQEVHQSSAVDEARRCLESLAPEQWPRGWELVMEKWAKWNEALRPCVVTRIRLQMEGHLKGRLEASSDSAATERAAEAKELARILAWLERTDIASERQRWSCLHARATKWHLKCTETSRWAVFIEQAIAAEKAEELTNWDALLDSARACRGLTATADDVAILSALAQSCLQWEPIGLETATFLRDLMEFIPGADASLAYAVEGLF